MKKTILLCILTLFCVRNFAQAPFNGKIENALRVNLYPAFLWGDNLYASANSSTRIQYRGAGLTTEIYNYHFLDYFSFSFLETANNNFRMLGFRNSFTYFMGDKFKIQYFAGIAVTPKGYHTYTIDSIARIDNPGSGELSGGYRPIVVSDSIQQNPDYFIHNGAYFKTNNHKINLGLGGFFIYRPGFDVHYSPLQSSPNVNDPTKTFYYYDPDVSLVKTRAAMQSYQLNAYIEFYKTRKLSGSFMPGILINNLFPERFFYMEAEVNYRPFRTTSMSFNLMMGKSRFMYSHVDGGYMIYNEDVLNLLAGLKISQRLSNRFELMAKAELMSFRLADTYSYYAGIKYYLKEF